MQGLHKGIKNKARVQTEEHNRTASVNLRSFLLISVYQSLISSDVISTSVCNQSLTHISTITDFGWINCETICTKSFSNTQQQLRPTPQSSVPARQKYSFKNTQTRVGSDHRNLTYCVNRQTDKGSRSRESDKELNASFSLCCLRATICVSTAPASLALCDRRPPEPTATTWSRGRAGGVR